LSDAKFQDLRMIDVTDKPITRRRAVAAAQVRMLAETAQAISDGTLPKGNVLAAARLAGITAAKQTSILVPLCHNIPLTNVEVSCTAIPPLQRVCIQAATVAEARTGVEMDALTAVSLAALTIYDMCKGVDRAAYVHNIMVLTKAGGRSGYWRAPGVGEVVAVSISKQKDTPKSNVPEIDLQVDYGVSGDAHAGPGPRQVSLLATESIQQARERGVNAGPGDFAENITTAGLKLSSLPLETPLLLGTTGVGIVSQIGKEGSERSAIARQLGESLIPREGIFVRIIHPGQLRPGDLIQVLAD